MHPHATCASLCEQRDFLWHGPVQVTKRSGRDPGCCIPPRKTFLLFETCVLSRVWLFSNPWTVAHQTPLSVEFSRQDYRSGLPLPLPGDLSDPGIELTSPAAFALAGGFFTTVPLRRPFLLFEGECLSNQRCMRLSTGWWHCQWHDSSRLVALLDQTSSSLTLLPTESLGEL